MGLVKYRGFFLALLCILGVNLFLYPTSFFKAEMWAEAGTNYFYHAHYSGFIQNLIQDDYGYLPWLPRLISNMVEQLHVPLRYLPQVYQGISIIFVSLCCALPALPFFRFVVASDFLRFLLAFSLALNFDYDLHMYINMTYYAAVPLTLFLFFPDQIAEALQRKRRVWSVALGLFGLLIMASKALFIVMAPLFAILWLRAVWQKNRVQITLTTLTLLGAVIQVLGIAYHAMHKVLPTEHLPLRTLLKSTLFNTVGLFYYAAIGNLLRTDLAVPAALFLVSTLLLLVYSAFYTYKKQDGRRLWWLICALVTAVLSSAMVTLNSFSISMPHRLALDFDYMSKRAWFIAVVPVYFFVAWQFLIWLQRKTENKTQFKKLTLQFLAVAVFVASNGPFHESQRRDVGWPEVGYSQWATFAPLMAESPDHYCVPLNPFLWTLNHNCEVLVAPDLAAVRFNDNQVIVPNYVEILNNLSTDSIQTLGFLYKNISTKTLPSVEIYMRSNTGNLIKIVSRSVRVKPNALYFTFNPPLTHVVGFRLCGIDKISAHEGHLQYVVYGWK